MQLHANAKTTPKARALLVQRVTHQSWTYRDAAAAVGVSVRTVAKWVQRARREGAAGLRDRRARPHRSPSATPPRTISAIIQWRPGSPRGRSLAGSADRARRCRRFSGVSVWADS
jgi:hypothetical protein